MKTLLRSVSVMLAIMVASLGAISFSAATMALAQGDDDTSTSKALDVPVTDPATTKAAPAAGSAANSPGTGGAGNSPGTGGSGTGGYKSEAGLKKQFMTFPALRSEVLNLIGSAKERIWLNSNFLSDGEIVTALYVAKYRKLDVLVLLDRKQANNYMSRLDYLKRQSIPVFLKPDRFPITQPTAVIIDNMVYGINANLDFLTAARSFQLEGISDALAGTWGKAFEAAKQQALPAVARPLPQVGRVGVHQNYYRPPSNGTASKNPPQYKEDGAYNYDRSGSSRDKIPEGVAKKLPKETLYQQRAKSGQKLAIPAGGSAPSRRDAETPENTESATGSGPQEDVLPSTP